MQLRKGEELVTPVEKEVLLALFKLGRRISHTVHEITNTRLWVRTYPSDPHPQDQKGVRPHRYNRNNKYAQCLHATEKKLSMLAYKGWAEVCHERTKAGPRLRLIFGPFYKITKEGQKEAKKLR